MKIHKILLGSLCVFAVSCNPGDNASNTTNNTKTLTLGAYGNLCIDSNNVIIYPAPENEVLNARYKVTADNLEVSVYDIKVASESKENRKKAKEDIANSGNYFEVAGMAYFDLKNGPITVTVSVEEQITEARILPESFKITPEINGNTLSFEVDKPQNLTIEINGESVRSLHLFVNNEETDIPDPNDPNVVYFTPGSYRFPAAEIEDGMTVYIAGGAVVHCYVGPHEWYTINPVTGQKNYDKFYMYDLNGKNITFRGRGIIDQSGIPTHSRRIVHVHGENIKLEGVIFRNPSEWTIDIQDSKDVKIDNIKIIGYRAQTDGIEIKSSHDIQIENCFIRSFGYPVVNNKSTNIESRNSIIWNDGENTIENKVAKNNLIHSVFK